MDLKKVKKRLGNRPDDVIKAIINGDDLGMSISCTDAIYHAYKMDILTDTTIIANGNAFDRAVDYIKQDIDIASNVGVHINLTAGKPLTALIKKCSKLVHDGFFTRYLLTRKSKLSPLSKKEKNAIEEEIYAQIKNVMILV